MGDLLRLTVHNYRCLRDVDFPAGAINVLFGPNGVGKTTFLDALWFVRDCAMRGTAEAASDRHHGIGALTDGAPAEDQRISIGVETNAASYQVTFGYSSGRIEPFVGERLSSKTRDLVLVNRAAGSDKAVFYYENLKRALSITLRDPERLALSNFLSFREPAEEAAEVDALLRSLRPYSSRAVNLHQLRRLGAESGAHAYLLDRWQNLWSALRNLSGRGAVDDRFQIIMEYMRKAFPNSFLALSFEPLGADRVTAEFVEKGKRAPIPASGVSDGHLQLLGLLTALYGDNANGSGLLLFDEPETSLHPHAIAVFAEAVRDAAAHRGRQVFLATHSPVLISQFEPSDVVVVESDSTGSSTMTRLSDVDDLRDLLEQYSIGSLYMAEEVGRQSARESAGSEGLGQ